MSTLDELMTKDPLELSAQDIDEMIVYHRKARLMFDSGVKPKKGPSAHPTISLTQLGLVPKAPAIKRRKIT